VPTVVANGGVGAFNDLHIDKSATSNTTPGGTITYTIEVWNTGSDDAQNVAVRDALPAATTFVSAADSAPAPTGTSPATSPAASSTASAPPSSPADW
jgi:uncharacterized repeat protein (TIGR01451 family)